MSQYLLSESLATLAFVLLLPATAWSEDLTRPDLGVASTQEREHLKGHKRYDLPICKAFEGKASTFPLLVSREDVRRNLLGALEPEVDSTLAVDQAVFDHVSSCVQTGKSKDTDAKDCQCLRANRLQSSYKKMNHPCKGVASFRDMEMMHRKMRLHLAFSQMRVGEFDSQHNEPEGPEQRNLTFGTSSKVLSNLMVMLPKKLSHPYFQGKVPNLSVPELDVLRGRLRKIEKNVISEFVLGFTDSVSGRHCGPEGLKKMKSTGQVIYPKRVGDPCAGIFRQKLKRGFELQKISSEEAYSSSIFSNLWLPSLNYAPEKISAQKSFQKKLAARREVVANGFNALKVTSEAEQKVIAGYTDAEKDKLFLYKIPLGKIISQLQPGDQHQACALVQSVYKENKWTELKQSLKHMGAVIGAGVAAGVGCSAVPVLGNITCAVVGASAAAAVDISNFKILNEKRNRAYKSFKSGLTTKEQLTSVVDSVFLEKSMTVGMTVLGPIASRTARTLIAGSRLAKVRGGLNGSLFKTKWRKSMTAQEIQGLTRALGDKTPIDGSKESLVNVYNRVGERMLKIAEKQAETAKRNLVHNPEFTPGQQDRLMRSVNRVIGNLEPNEQFVFLKRIDKSLRELSSLKPGSPAYRKKINQLKNDETILSTLVGKRGKGLGDKFDQMVLTLRASPEQKAEIRRSKPCVVRGGKTVSKRGVASRTICRL